MEKTRIALGALGVYVTGLAVAAVNAASASTTLQARSAEELARYIAAGGAAVAC